MGQDLLLHPPCSLGVSTSFYFLFSNFKKWLGEEIWLRRKLVSLLFARGQEVYGFGLWNSLKPILIEVSIQKLFQRLKILTYSDGVNKLFTPRQTVYIYTNDISSYEWKMCVLLRITQLILLLDPDVIATKCKSYIVLLLWYMYAQWKLPVRVSRYVFF